MLKKLHVPIIVLLLMSSVTKPYDSCTNFRIAGTTFCVTAILSIFANGFTYWRHLAAKKAHYQQLSEQNDERQFSVLNENKYYLGRVVTASCALLCGGVTLILSIWAQDACNTEN